MGRRKWGMYLYCLGHEKESVFEISNIAKERRKKKENEERKSLGIINPSPTLRPSTQWGFIVCETIDHVLLLLLNTNQRFPLCLFPAFIHMEPNKGN
jgi:hypothetical protein